MGEIWLRCDIRSAPFGMPTPWLAQLHLEQAAWADKQGFDAIQLPEHHGSADGYDPSPFVLGAALAARTERMRIHPSAVLLPLLDPVRVAEDAVVLDNISNGRLDLTIGLGYVPAEFAMFGISLADRAKRVEEGLDLLRRTFAGETVDYHGRAITIRPRPATEQGPRIFVGGAVPAAAKRAARFGDGFAPSKVDPVDLIALYKETCRELGKEPGVVFDPATGPQFVYVTEDPDEAWAKIAPFASYETNAYKKWGEATGADMPFQAADGLDALKATGLYKVVTPDECLAIGQSLFERDIVMIFNPTLCGMDEKFSWASLELFAHKVLPRLRGGLNSHV